MEKIDFGKKLINLRKVRGLTQEEVAEKCNITARTIQRIESGTVKPRSSTIKIISKTLGFDFYEISNQNSELKNHTVLWYFKDLFNLKTNAMKKISILTTSLLILTIVCVNIFSIEAQSKTTEQKQETVLKNELIKVDFSRDFDEFKIEGDFVFVRNNNKYGLINVDGKIIIPCEYDKLQFEENYVFTLKNRKYGLMNLDGKTIIPCKYDKLQFEENYVFTLKSQKYGLMNLDGKTIIPCDYDKLQFEENYVFTLKNDKHGLMNLDGEVIIPCEYDTMKIEEAIAIVTKNGKTNRIQI